MTIRDISWLKIFSFESQNYGKGDETETKCVAKSDIILNHDFSADLERSSSLMVWHYLDPDPMLVRYTVLGRPEFPAVHREFAGLR